MKRIVSLLLMAAGLALLALGLLFAIGAAGKAFRYVVAAIAMVLGAVLAGFGLRLSRSAEAEAPDQILALVLGLARKGSGRVSEAEIFAALGRRARLAPPILERLVSAGLAERTRAEGGALYLFKGLQTRLFMRKCEYCGEELTIANPARRCPTCGGALKAAVEPTETEGGNYRMDE